MNLLVISSTFPNNDDAYIGGIFVKEQIKYLKNYFENIYVVSPAPFGIGHLRKTKHENYEFDNVKVYFPKYINFPPFYLWKRDLWVNFEMKTIKSLIATEKMKFDIIHAHSTWPSGAVAVEMKKEFNVPVVITVHASVTFSKAIKNKEPVYLETWKNCDVIIRVRKGDLCDLINLGILKDKLYHIPNGYGEKFLQIEKKSSIRKSLNLPVNKKIILNVGNMYSEVKGHKHLIEAMAKVLKQRKDVFCVIVGDGKLMKDLKAQIKKLDLENYVKLVGSKSHDEIPLWMNAADLFVLPSLRESFGIVQIEALACGKPVVATINGGSEEIIISEEYGLLCEPANPKDLAEKIIIGLDKEWDTRKILNYSKRFTWDNVAKEIMEIYNELLI